MKPEIKKGYYRHFRGDVYQVFGLVQDTEYSDWLVLYGKSEPEWVRPTHIFFSTVLVELKGVDMFVPRFEFLGEYPKAITKSDQIKTPGANRGSKITEDNHDRKNNEFR